MTDKALVLDTIRKLSEEATLEEIIETLSILAAIRRGEDAADAGSVISHEELKKELVPSWTTK